MMNNLYIDTETTGTEEHDRLIQVAYQFGDVEVNKLYSPPEGVELGFMAMATHHITPDMLEGKPLFEGSTEQQELLDIADRSVFVAHNARFDLDMLSKEGVEFPQHICTLKVARFLDTEGKMESYKLQYLRYRLGIKVDAVAHDAYGDILVLMRLWLILAKSLRGRENLSLIECKQRMIEISNNPVEIRRFNFGKHNGSTVEEVAQEDSSYLNWLLGEKLKEPDGEEDWIYTLKLHLGHEV